MDYVTYEGEIVGKNAVKYIDGENVGKRRIEIIAGENVGVLFPKWFDPSEDLTIYLRSRKPIESGTLVIEGILEKKVQDLVPSEMLRLKVPKGKIDPSERLKVFIKEE